MIEFIVEVIVMTIAQIIPDRWVLGCLGTILFSIGLIALLVWLISDPAPQPSLPTTDGFHT